MKNSDVRKMPASLAARLHRPESVLYFRDLVPVITPQCRKTFFDSLSRMLRQRFGESYPFESGPQQDMSVSQWLRAHVVEDEPDIDRAISMIMNHPDYGGFSEVAPIMMEAFRPCWRSFSLSKAVDPYVFSIDLQLKYGAYNNAAFSDVQMLWINAQMMRAASAFMEDSVVHFLIKFAERMEEYASRGEIPSDGEFWREVRKVPQFVGDFEPLAMDLMMTVKSNLESYPVLFAGVLLDRDPNEFSEADGVRSLAEIDAIIRNSFGGEIPDLTMSASGEALVRSSTNRGAVASAIVGAAIGALAVSAASRSK